MKTTHKQQIMPTEPADTRPTLTKRSRWPAVPDALATGCGLPSAALAPALDAATAAGGLGAGFLTPSPLTGRQTMPTDSPDACCVLPAGDWLWASVISWVSWEGPNQLAKPELGSMP